jgi:exosortase/archaeosortase family protein
MHRDGSRSLLLTLTSAILLMGIFSLLPDGLYQRVFCRIPAALSAAYFGAECHGTSFRLRTGLEVSVTRACGGSDFFALLCGLGLAAGWRARRRQPATGWLGRLLLHVLLALGATLLVNGMRIIVTVYTRLAAEPFLPARFLGAVHLFSGVLVFFPALLFLVKYGKLEGET